MAALGNWTISGLDIRNAYLYSKLDQEISMEQPECQSPYFIFTLFALLTSLLIKYSHSHPPYYLRYLRSLTTFIRLAQHYHTHPLLTFFLPFYELKNTPRTRSE